MHRMTIPIASGEERVQRPITREPWHKSGDDDGPKAPDVKRPDPSDLLKRSRLDHGGRILKSGSAGIPAGEL